MPELPKLKLLEKVDQFEIWQVDGRYIRDNINREFTNFGQHFTFSFIPKYEFWIDKEFAPNESNFFIDHLLYEWHFMNEGDDYTTAADKADVIEIRERLKSKYYQKKIMQRDGELKKILPVKLHVKKIKKYSKKVNVWVIDGELVRDIFHVEFTEGGHYYIYDFVPEKEVWIDNDLSEREIPFVILHELHERTLMQKGMDYDSAHRSSSIIEYKCRRKELDTEECIKRELELME